MEAISTITAYIEPVDVATFYDEVMDTDGDAFPAFEEAFHAEYLARVEAAIQAALDHPGVRLAYQYDEAWGRSTWIRPDGQRYSYEDTNMCDVLMLLLDHPDDVEIILDPVTYAPFAAEDLVPA